MPVRAQDQTVPDVSGPADTEIPPEKPRQKHPRHGAPDDDSDGFSCAGKTKCAQMDSCAEARFYLRACGVTRLDRDHDGVPCESICR